MKSPKQRKLNSETSDLNTEQIFLAMRHQCSQQMESLASHIQGLESLFLQMNEHSRPLNQLPNTNPFGFQPPKTLNIIPVDPTNTATNPANIFKNFHPFPTSHHPPNSEDTLNLYTPKQTGPTFFLKGLSNESLCYKVGAVLSRKWHSTPEELAEQNIGEQLFTLVQNTTQDLLTMKQTLRLCLKLSNDQI